MNLSPEVWDIIKIVLGAYLVYVMNQNSRNQREVFRRLRAVELSCAANHGLVIKGEKDANP